MIEKALREHFLGRFVNVQVELVELRLATDREVDRERLMIGADDHVCVFNLSIWVLQEINIDKGFSWRCLFCLIEFMSNDHSKSIHLNDNVNKPI